MGHLRRAGMLAPRGCYAVPHPAPRRVVLLCRLGEALERPFPDRLQFVLGTESGMITSIVRWVTDKNRQAGCLWVGDHY